jgi:UDP-2,4-diacetamido-2,4,6-trideoxy-beta-L-altropyranose hydrolase
MKTFRLIPWHSTHSGLGHVYRMAALAEMLNGQLEYTISLHEDLQSSFEHLQPTQIGAGEPEVEELVSSFEPADDILVLDGYCFDYEYQLSLKVAGFTLIRVDDFGNQHVLADLFINHSPAAPKLHYTSEAYASLALGSDYALLRPEFLERAQIPAAYVPSEFKSVLLSFGAADPFSLAKLYSEKLLTRMEIERITILGHAGLDHPKVTIKSGLSAPELLEELEGHDLLICTSSNIFMELCCVGKCAAVGYFAENQKGIAQAVESAKAAHYLDDLREEVDVKLEEMFERSTSLWQGAIEAQRKFVDGQQLVRILKAFRSLLGPAFRPASDDDVRLIFEWANEASVRENSINSAVIEWEGHQAWFRARLQDPNYRMIIFSEGEDALGLVRFERDGASALVSISVDRAHRGKGLSKAMLEQAIRLMQEEGIAEVLADVLDSNEASQRLFESCGFVKKESWNQADRRFNRFVLNLS